ncbi:PDZ domain-containing protein [Candidatus Beckwithbacteria bacterium]|nr:PDZ domain-containing protein [Candidatus Beckwithbacteria bacterium]
MSKKTIIVIAVVILGLGMWLGVSLNSLVNLDQINSYLGKISNNKITFGKSQTNKSEIVENQGLIEKQIVKEEDLVVEVVDKASPSVVTVGIHKSQKVVTGDPFSGLFDPFSFFNSPQIQPQVEEQQIEQNIGTGFVITKDGLIVTNKHVVSDTQATYKIISADNKEYKVSNIYRDPTLDIAIIKIENYDLNPLPLGDSDQLKVGQFVIAIGTALGEFRNTVTTGVVSGLGRGVTTSGYGIGSERLENVIQTDAAINPGNSGGPLINSSGQVIGVNVATSVGAEGISFSIPINVIKEAITNFNETGKFERAFLGVKYKMISRDLSILNEIPEGAYLVEVVDNSPASKAGLKQGDIVIKIDGQSLSNVEGGLAKLISSKKIGDNISIEYWRNGQKQTVDVKLGDATSNSN